MLTIEERRRDRDGLRICYFTFRDGSSTSDAELMLAKLRDIEAGSEPFALAIETDGKSPLPPPERREFAAWFRRSKPWLKARCRGMARIADDAGMFQRLSAKAMALLTPFPMHVATRRDAADQWIESLT